MSPGSTAPPFSSMTSLVLALRSGALSTVMLAGPKVQSASGVVPEVNRASTSMVMPSGMGDCTVPTATRVTASSGAT